MVKKRYGSLRGLRGGGRVCIYHTNIGIYIYLYTTEPPHPSLFPLIYTPLPHSMWL